MRRGDLGRYRFKIVFYGPSLSGKTTILRWIHGKITSLYKGDMTSIEDDTNRTMFFDYVPMSAGGRVIFDVFTVAGQRRHKHQRKVVIKDADYILFVMDASKKQKDENIYAFNELNEMFGSELGEKVKFVIILNKCDIDDRITKDDVIKLLGVNENVKIYKTVAIKGEGIKTIIQSIMRETISSAIHKVKSAQ